MNYIKRLQAENAELRDQVKAAQESITGTLVYLSSNKFRCGDRLDGYVSTGDMTETLRYLRSKLLLSSGS